MRARREVADLPMTVSATLRRSQYAGAARLRAREALWGFGAAPSYVESWLAALQLSGTETVLDVGCGYGRYLAALRGSGHKGYLLGADLSDGMASAACHTGAHVVVADITNLPFPNASVDVALAMHVLYHVADPQVAVRELHRVLRPGGTLLASANGARHVAEIRIVMNAAAEAVTGEPPTLGNLSFTLENGADHLGASFARVERTDSPQIVDVPSAEPVVAYIESFGPELTGVPLSSWDEYLEEASNLVREHIRHFGVFTVTGLPGVFICR